MSRRVAKEVDSLPKGQVVLFKEPRKRNMYENYPVLIRKEYERFDENTSSFYVCDQCHAEADPDDICYNGESVGLSSPLRAERTPDCPYCGFQLTHILDNDKEDSNVRENTLEDFVED